MELDNYQDGDLQSHNLMKYGVNDDIMLDNLQLRVHERQKVLFD